MTIKDMKQIRENLKQSLKDIDELIKEEHKSKYPDNLMGGYLLCGGGDIAKTLSGDREYVEKCFDQGNWFPTRALAEKEAKRRVTMQKMKGFTNGYERQIDMQNYFIYFRDNNLIISSLCFLDMSDLVCFESIKDAQACIDAMGDEILEFYK